MDIRIQLSGRDITSAEFDTVTSGSVDTVTARFSFDAVWNEYATKTAVFASRQAVKHVILDDSGICTVPWEVLTSGGSIVIGVIGQTGSRIFPSVKATVCIHDGIYSRGTAPSEPSPDIYDQIVQLMQQTQQIAQSVRDDADNGKFNGADGDSYILTDEDKTEIANDVKKTSVQKSDANNVVYARYGNADTTIPFSAGEAAPYSIGRRDSRGCFISAEPVLDSECATKGYVDGLVGDIESVLDEIIALQESYIGGESE